MPSLTYSTSPPAAAPPAHPLGMTHLPAFLLRPVVVLPPWHAVKTFPNRELAVADRFADLSIDVYCPKFTASWASRGRKVSRILPYLSTYIFARWNAADPHLWHALKAVSGVSGFLGGSVPSPVPDAEIEALRAFVGSGDRLIDAVLTWVPGLGSEVRVIDGPFLSYDGVVASVDPPLVSVKIFGLFSRETVVTLPVNWCEPVNEALGSASSYVPSYESTRRRNRARRSRYRRRDT